MSYLLEWYIFHEETLEEETEDKLFKKKETEKYWCPVDRVKVQNTFFQFPYIAVLQHTFNVEN